MYTFTVTRSIIFPVIKHDDIIIIHYSQLQIFQISRAADSHNFKLTNSPLSNPAPIELNSQGKCDKMESHFIIES